MAKQAAKCPSCGHRLEVDPAETTTLVCPICHKSLTVPGSKKRVRRRDPLLDRVLGDFEIQELVGRGGMGSVYKGRQKSLDRLVAIKTLSRSLAGNKAFVARFYREARNAATLSHPNLVGVYAVGEADGTHYIAMEFIEGEGLNAVLSRDGPLAPEEALGALKQVCSGLAAAHEMGIIHRDIKPSNLMRDPSGRVHVTDFGLAKRTEGDVSVTQTGQALGTPLYIAPEAASGGPPDPRSDLYSLAATFYHLIAGRPPFQGGTFTELVIQHVNETPPALAELVPGLDRRLARIIDRLLRKNPAARHASARELLAELEALGPLKTGTRPAGMARTSADAATPPTMVSRHARTETRPGGVPRARRQRGRGAPVGPLVAVVVGVALLVACVAVWLAGRKSKPRRQVVATPPTTPASVPAPKVDPREKEAAACYRTAERAFRQRKWRTVRYYLERLESDYSITEFYTDNRKSIDALAARVQAELRRIEVARKPVPKRDPALDWIDLTASRNLHYWRKVKGGTGRSAPRSWSGRTRAARPSWNAACRPWRTWS